jgi:SHS family lactate transporter-like MFS transporter
MMAREERGETVAFEAWKGWTLPQRHVVVASYLGWTLDAFDFFLLVFVMPDVAASFGVPLSKVAFAVTLTLALRPLGALFFGLLADRFGRRPILMLDVALYSLIGFASAFAPNLTAFLAIRALFGVAMGGEWGIGAALTMETIPQNARGLVSGALQSGYPSGYLLAGAVFALFYPVLGWRGMFMVGLLPALLILYIRAKVPESPVLKRGRPSFKFDPRGFAGHLRLALYAVALMTAFNFFSHGTQDLYPSFLEKQRHFDHATAGAVAVIYNVGAILGGLAFGLISQAIGRRYAIVLAALLAIPTVWLWAYSETAAMLASGAFLLQFFVQGAWGVIPVHLNELSPPAIRGTFAGTVYQLGNFIASYNAVMQAKLAESHGGDYSLALTGVAIAAALAIALLAGFGREAKGVDLTTGLMPGG